MSDTDWSLIDFSEPKKQTGVEKSAPVSTCITPERVRSLFRYDEATGWLIWNERPRSDFATETAWRGINTRKAGKRAGYLSLADGYIHIGIDGKLYRAHRLIWLYVYGCWPDDQIDHISHDRADNRLENLRESSDAENRKNQSISQRNTSGATGVHWFKRRQRWQAFINEGGKRRNLGYFHSKSEAIAARGAAEAQLGFHENHGRAA